MEYYRAFGFTLCTDLPLDNWLNKTTSTSTDLLVTRVDKLPDLQSPPLYSSFIKTKEGLPRYTIQKEGDEWLIRMLFGGNFWITPNKIQVHFKEDDMLPAILHFLSVGMAFWLEQKNLRALHASAVVLGEKAAVFLAASNTGKSTLAAALLQHGGALLSDDILPVEEISGKFFLRPGYASMRVSFSLGEHFKSVFDKSLITIPGFPKQIVKFGSGEWAPFYDQIIAPSAFYILEKNQKGADNNQVEIQNLSNKEAALALLRFLFFPVHNQNEIVNQEHRLNLLSRLAIKTPIKKLFIPNGYQHFSQITEKIKNDLRETQAR